MGGPCKVRKIVLIPFDYLRTYGKPTQRLKEFKNESGGFKLKGKLMNWCGNLSTIYLCDRQSFIPMLIHSKTVDT